MRSRRFAVFAAGLVTLACCGDVVAAAPAPSDLGPVQGITISCWRWGHEWASPDMRALMTTLPEVGANWLAIHPYARVSRETGEVLWSPRDRSDHVSQPIRWARELGLRIMIKPHLAYWGQWSWRGEIGWGGDEERWRRFERSYRSWILHLAQLCEREGADLFVVGTELRQAEPRLAWWGPLLRDIRRAYRGPLTYAANWDDYERVPFWKQLDLIGVQAYFPLSGAADPSQAELLGAWRRHAAELTRFSKAVGRPVLLAEVGYSNSAMAAAKPWEASHGPGPTALQARCLRAALTVASETPAIQGAFVWKWFPTTQSLGPSDFTVQTPAFKRLLRETWAPVTASPVAGREEGPPTASERARGSAVAEP